MGTIPGGRRRQCDMGRPRRRWGPKEGWERGFAPQGDDQTVPLGMQGRWRQDGEAAVEQKGTRLPLLHWGGFRKESQDGDLQLEAELPGFEKKSEDRHQRHSSSQVTRAVVTEIEKVQEIRMWNLQIPSSVTHSAGCLPNARALCTWGELHHFITTHTPCLLSPPAPPGNLESTGAL